MDAVTAAATLDRTLDRKQRRLERCRQPEPGEYRRIELRADGAVTPVQLLEIVSSLADLFPTR